MNVFLGGAGLSTAKLKTLDLSFNPLSDFSQLKGRQRVPGDLHTWSLSISVNFPIITCVFPDLQV